MVALLVATALVSPPAAGNEQDFVLICVPNFAGKLVPWGCHYATQRESRTADRSDGLAVPPPKRPRVAGKKAAPHEQR